MTSRPKYNQYLTSNRRQVPAGIGICLSSKIRPSLVVQGKKQQKYDEFCSHIPNSEKHIMGCHGNRYSMYLG